MVIIHSTIRSRFTFVDQGRRESFPSMALTPAYRFSFFLLLLVMPFLVTAQTYMNKSQGSSLTTSDSISSWVSPSQEFAFGFRQVGSGGGYLLAIWFNKISERTIVWSANRDKLAPKGSKVELSNGGNLVLYDPKGQQLWSASPFTTGVAYAAMLDTGNFVLATQDSVNLWESFNLPTDTLLPTQNLNEKEALVAASSETNYSTGRFRFQIQDNGNLVLYTTDRTGSTSTLYWSSGTNNGFQVIFNQSGSIYLTASNGTLLKNISISVYSAANFYLRVVLESDGVLRHYAYPKSKEISAGRSMEWFSVSYTPPNICINLTTASESGACGFNSLCKLGDDGRRMCECPFGYTFIDPTEVSSDCRQEFAPQSCDRRLDEAGLFDFTDMLNTDWPLADYEHFNTYDEDLCRYACLGDCFCTVAIFRDGNCWKKKMPLSNGRIDRLVGGKALIKKRIGNSTSPILEIAKTKKKDTILIIVGSCFLGSSVFLILTMTTFFLICRSNYTKTTIHSPCSVLPEINLRSFSYKEIEEATNSFKEELGKGAFSTVYKGVISTENKILVAVKKLDKFARDNEKEFKVEVSAIGRTNHKNLVQLVGFCAEEEHFLLVYEFMSNGSLANYLFENSKPTWHRRIQIALGTARGILYLHEECSTQIIHCDIKPQNILLDDSYSAKISDFGLAKILLKDQTRTTTGIRGTKGYVAPEWFKNMSITVKVDVYSFGIVFLELLCCRKCLELEMEDKDEDQVILVDWAYDCYMEGKLHLLVENDEEAKHEMKTFEKFIMIAIWCIQEDPLLRPTMKKVIQMLEGAVEVSIPPHPTSFISSIQVGY